MAAAGKYEIDTEHWGEPPIDPSGHPGDWPKRLARFDARPGEWGIVVFDVNKATMQGVATRLNAGAYKGIERGQYEAVVGKHPTFDDKWAVWVRRTKED